MHITVQIVRARGLPRLRILRGPDAYAELYVHPGAPASAVTPVASRGTDPSWDDFRADVELPPGTAPPLTLGVVVRDAGSSGAVAGRAYLRVAASLTEGWFPLTADDASRAGAAWRPPRDPDAYVHPAAEVFVRVEWPAYCALRRPAGAAALAVDDPDGDVDSELRMTSDEPGRYFRCGELVVQVKASGVPASLRDAQLTVKTPDQCLRGYEVATGAGSDGSASGVSEDVRDEAEDDDASAVLSSVEEEASSGRRTVDFGSFAFSLFQGTFPDYVKLSLRDRGAHNAVTAKLLSVSDEKAMIPVDFPGYASEPRHAAGPGTRKMEMESASASKDVSEGEEVEALSERHSSRVKGWLSSKAIGVGAGLIGRRWVSGSTSQSSPPQRVLSDYDEERSFTYVVQLRVSPPGNAASKVVYDLRLSYSLWQPPASCTIVTPRFRELFGEVEDLSKSFLERYPVAKDLTVLFVGGLFTDHYPLYYQHNITYLRDVVGVTDIRTVPIHTEKGIEVNAKILRDYVVDVSGENRNIVLVAHSKGGVDVCAAIARYPELVPLVFGFIAFQTPFGGTYLIDFLARSRIAVKTFGSALRALWGGEEDSMLDMGYKARIQDILFGGKGSSSEVETPSGDAQEGQSSDLSRSEVQVLDDAHVADRLLVYGDVPTVSFASSASYLVTHMRSVANVAGFASMAPLAMTFSSKTGFECDGLVAPCDARVPYSDLVHLHDMMHTEPALYFPGSKYPPGELTTVALALVFEKRARRETDAGGSQADVSCGS